MFQPKTSASQVGVCSIHDCDRAAQQGGLFCWGHLKRLQRKGRTGGKLGAKGRRPVDVFRDAMYAFLEFDEGRDSRAWARAWARVRMAARRYVEAEKPHSRYRKPPQVNGVLPPGDTQRE